jgi:ribosomal-protein-alanine N-acetyltransferase
MTRPAIRPGTPEDIEAIAAIQKDSPEAAQWEVAGYLQYKFLVALWDNQPAGFLVWRAVDLSPGGVEGEILNLAVKPDFRRRGIARTLVNTLIKTLSGPVFLEVRASNNKALLLYKSVGFQEVGKRSGYYENPTEAAIVMKFHSC